MTETKRKPGKYPKPIVIPARKCRICGCSDHDCRGCIEKTGEPCYWVEKDLCSACAGAPKWSELKLFDDEAYEAWIDTII